MRMKLVLVSIVLVSFVSCTKSFDNIIRDIKIKNYSPDAPGSFVTYTILKGNQYCDKNVYQRVKYNQLSFFVKFDSSAIYKTADPANQNDINKLFGFSDNNALHHLFSARFGWRWSENKLRLFAYIYNNGVMSNREIGQAAFGIENSCTIKVSDSLYTFTLNNKSVTMPRMSETVQAEGYKLYPYFGGDEAAPHTISIFIKEL